MDLLSERFVGAVGARINVKSSYSNSYWILNKIFSVASPALCPTMERVMAEVYLWSMPCKFLSRVCSFKLFPCKFFPFGLQRGGR